MLDLILIVFGVVLLAYGLLAYGLFRILKASTPRPTSNAEPILNSAEREEAERRYEAHCLHLRDKGWTDHGGGLFSKDGPPNRRR